MKHTMILISNWQSFKLDCETDSPAAELTANQMAFGYRVRSTKSRLPSINLHFRFDFYEVHGHILFQMGIKRAFLVTNFGQAHGSIAQVRHADGKNGDGKKI